MSLHIAHIDADRTGSRSISDRIESKIVRSFAIDSFELAEKRVREITTGKYGPFDYGVFDTLNGLTSYTKQDITGKGILEFKKTRQSTETVIWNNLKQLAATDRDWGYIGDSTVRLLRVIRDSGMPWIIVCHEGIRDTPVGNAFSPDMQKMILSDLFAFSDAIIRVRHLPVDTEVHGEAYEAGRRLCVMHSSDDTYAGVRSPETVPPVIMLGKDAGAPNWNRIIDALGEMPQSTCLYGPPKVGKTKLATSATRLTPRDAASPARKTTRTQ